MSNVVKLVSSREHPETRACGTCRHMKKDSFGPTWAACRALSYNCSTARTYEHLCGQGGKFWEPKPPREYGIFERAWRYLFGGRP